MDRVPSSPIVGSDRRERSRKRTSFSIFRVVMIAIAGALSLSQSLSQFLGGPADSNGQFDGASTQSYERRYTVTFQPIAGAEPVTFRDENGNIIGAVGDSAVLDVTVNESTLRAATTPQGIHMGKLVAALSTTQTSQGNFMRVAAPFQMRTTRGTVIQPGQAVLIDLRRYGTLGVVQPAGSWGVGANGRPTSDQVSDRFNDVLRDKGVTGTTRTPTPRATTHGQAPLNDSIGRANDSYGERFFSSPTCECRAGSCQMTSYFGKRNSFRNTNGTRASSFHQGLDVAGGAGTPIIAAADGCVSRKLTNRSTGYGLSVYLDHGNGYVSQYSHLQSIASSVAVGQCFKRGDVIGAMGKTGNCTGPHLHFGVYKNGTAVDPLKHMIAKSNGDLSRSCSAQPQVQPVLASGANAGASSGATQTSRSGQNGMVR